MSLRDTDRDERVEDGLNATAMRYARQLDEWPALEHEAWQRSLYACDEDCDCIRCRALRILTRERGQK